MVPTSGKIYHTISHIVVPYSKRLSDSCQSICSKQGIQMHFRAGKTIKDLLVNPKDKNSIIQKSGEIHRNKCGRVDCEHEYIKESGRTLTERFKEHMKAPHPSMTTTNTTGQAITVDNFSIMGGRNKVLPDQLKKPFSSESMTHS